VDVHHVPGLVVTGGNVGPQLIGQMEVLHGVLCREVRGGAVVVAGRDLARRWLLTRIAAASRSASET
jgi:hypothetical protein